MSDRDDASVESGIAAALLSSRSRDEIYGIVGSRVRELSGALAVAVSRYDERDRTVSLAFLAGFDSLKGVLRRIAGFDYATVRLPLSAMTEEELASFTSGRLGRLGGACTP